MDKQDNAVSFKFHSLYQKGNALFHIGYWQRIVLYPQWVFTLNSALSTVGIDIE